MFYLKLPQVSEQSFPFYFIFGRLLPFWNSFISSRCETNSWIQPPRPPSLYTIRAWCPVHYFLLKFIQIHGFYTVKCVFIVNIKRNSTQNLEVEVCYLSWFWWFCVSVTASTSGHKFLNFYFFLFLKETYQFHYPFLGFWKQKKNTLFPQWCFAAARQEEGSHLWA